MRTWEDLGEMPRAQFDLLLHRARRGDDDAWRHLYDQLAGDLRGYLLAQSSPDVDALLGETWLHIARDLGDFSGGSQDLRRWVFTIARHRAIDQRRWWTARPAWPFAPSSLPDEPVDDQAVAELLEQDGAERVQRLLGRLTAKQRDALALRFIGGLDTHEVAEVMGIQRNAVKSLQRRGIARLRTMLDA